MPPPQGLQIGARPLIWGRQCGWSLGVPKHHVVYPCGCRFTRARSRALFTSLVSLSLTLFLTPRARLTAHARPHTHGCDDEVLKFRPGGRASSAGPSGIRTPAPDREWWRRKYVSRTHTLRNASRTWGVDIAQVRRRVCAHATREEG